MFDKMLKQLNEKTSDLAFMVLGVALLLMFPRNIFSPPYWIAVASWAIADWHSENSRLAQLSELL